MFLVVIQTTSSNLKISCIRRSVVCYVFHFSMCFLLADINHRNVISSSCTSKIYSMCDMFSFSAIWRRLIFSHPHETILASGAFQFKIYFVFDFYVANRSKQIFIMHVCLLIVFNFSRSDRRRNKILNVYSFRLPSFIPHMYVHRCFVYSRVSQIILASLPFCLMFIHMYTQLTKLISFQMCNICVDLNEEGGFVILTHVHDISLLIWEQFSLEEKWQILVHEKIFLTPKSILRVSKLYRMTMGSSILRAGSSNYCRMKYLLMYTRSNENDVETW